MTRFTHPSAPPFLPFVVERAPSPQPGAEGIKPGTVLREAA